MTVAVIGGGHHSLVAAVCMARAGHRVQLFEARDQLGGLAAGAEFHPGYRHQGTLHDSSRLRPWVLQACGLSKTLPTRPAKPVPVVDPQSGEGVAGTPLGGIAPQVRDRLAQWLDRPAFAVAPQAPLGPLLRAAVEARGLGAARLHELLRVMPLSADRWLAEHTASPLARAGHALGGILGAFMGPWSPHSAGVLLWTDALREHEVVGGPSALVTALAQAAQQHGVAVHTESPVERLSLEGGRISGLYAGGQHHAADLVISGVSVQRTMLDLLPPEFLEPELEDRVRAVRSRGLVAVAHVALSGLPPARGGVNAQEHVRVVRSPEALERAFDAAKHVRVAEEPALDLRIPTLSDASLAPKGHHVITAHAFGVPHTPRGGWTDGARAQLRDAVLTALEGVFPGLAAHVVGVALLTPADLEATFGVPGGHLWHAEHALDQFLGFRPTQALAQHRTPVPGLVLASGATHPMGGITGACGAFAARAALGAAW